jgi:hypothetical protein
MRPDNPLTWSLTYSDHVYELERRSGAFHCVKKYDGDFAATSTAARRAREAGSVRQKLLAVCSDPNCQLTHGLGVLELRIAE